MRIGGLSNKVENSILGLKVTQHPYKITISVIGGHDIDARIEKLARDVGKLVAKHGAVLVCGGLTGVMQAAAKGCKDAGGLSIGLVPGKEKTEANPYIDIVLPTSIGFARNAMVACSADIIIALPGSHGTNSEVCYGLVYDRPVIDLGGWGIEGMIKVKDLKELDIVIRTLIKKIRNGAD